MFVLAVISTLAFDVVDIVCVCVFLFHQPAVSCLRSSSPSHRSPVWCRLWILLSYVLFLVFLICVFFGSFFLYYSVVWSFLVFSELSTCLVVFEFFVVLIVVFFISLVVTPLQLFSFSLSDPIFCFV